MYIYTYICLCTYIYIYLQPIKETIIEMYHNLGNFHVKKYLCVKTSCQKIFVNYIHMYNNLTRVQLCTKTWNGMEQNGPFHIVLFWILRPEAILYLSLNPKNFYLGIPDPKSCPAPFYSVSGFSNRHMQCVLRVFCVFNFCSLWQLLKFFNNSSFLNYGISHFNNPCILLGLAKK